MGMGEPMLNLDAVLEAARRLPDLGITHRRTTISTVGWLPGLTRFVDEVEEPIRLALSLHAADRRAPLAADAGERPLPARATCSPSAAATSSCARRKVFVEYVMLAGVNDRVEQARAARGGCSTANVFKVNLIPYNPTGRVRRLLARRRSPRSRRVLDRAGSRRRCASPAAATSTPPAASCAAQRRPLLAVERRRGDPGRGPRRARRRPRACRARAAPRPGSRGRGRRSGRAAASSTPSRPRIGSGELAGAPKVPFPFHASSIGSHAAGSMGRSAQLDGPARPSPVEYAAARLEVATGRRSARGPTPRRAARAGRLAARRCESPRRAGPSAAAPRPGTSGCAARSGR